MAKQLEKLNSLRFTKHFGKWLANILKEGFTSNDFTDEDKAKLDGLSSVTVDTKLSQTCGNPVKNSVIYNAIRNIDKSVRRPIRYISENPYFDLDIQTYETTLIATLSHIDTIYYPGDRGFCSCTLSETYNYRYASIPFNGDGVIVVLANVSNEGLVTLMVRKIEDTFSNIIHDKILLGVLEFKNRELVAYEGVLRVRMGLRVYHPKSEFLGNVVQTTGTSEIDVMSQKAVTDTVNNLPANRDFAQRIYIEGVLVNDYTINLDFTSVPGKPYLKSGMEFTVKMPAGLTNKTQPLNFNAKIGENTEFRTAGFPVTSGSERIPAAHFKAGHLYRFFFTNENYGITSYKIFYLLADLYETAKIGSCNTSSDTAAKTVSVTDYNGLVGSIITVIFANANTAVNPTLNVNGEGALPITYKNLSSAAIPAGWLKDRRFYQFLKMDTRWVFIGEVYENFKPSGTNAAAGLVPAPPTTAGTTKFLNEDGTWKEPPIALKTARYNNGVGVSGNIALDFTGAQYIRVSCSGDINITDITLPEGVICYAMIEANGHDINLPNYTHNNAVETDLVCSTHTISTTDNILCHGGFIEISFILIDDLIYTTFSEELGYAC